MVRPPCCEKGGVKKGPWTPEEDIVLVTYIQEHGPGNWRSVPTKTGLMRCSKSCRLRWTNYLRPGIKRGNFTPREEGIIIHLQAMLGNKWAAIASYLPQRTDNDIKNYWNTHLKKKLKKLQPLSYHTYTTPSASILSSHNAIHEPATANHPLSGSYAPSSTENLSKLLEGWMKSSAKCNEFTGEIHMQSDDLLDRDDDQLDSSFDLLFENEQLQQPPLSYLEKWLLEEESSGSVEDLMEMSCSANSSAP